MGINRDWFEQDLANLDLRPERMNVAQMDTKS